LSEVESSVVVSLLKLEVYLSIRMLSMLQKFDPATHYHLLVEMFAIMRIKLHFVDENEEDVV
jgi:hypothetical protein